MTHVAEHVRWRKIDGAVVILDLRSEKYFVLDAIGTAIWEGIAEGVDSQAEISALATRYGVSRERVAEDVRVFVDRAKVQGLLATRPAEPPPRLRAGAREGRPACPTLRAWWSLLATAHHLARHGFAATYGAYEALPVPDAAADVDERLAEAVAAFAKAENVFHMKRAPEDCVPRSLALFRFLRSVGIPVEHCIGVRRFPFGAHAWVEFRGEIVHDSLSTTTNYGTLARIGV